jgi:hypothetical protein
MLNYYCIIQIAKVSNSFTKAKKMGYSNKKGLPHLLIIPYWLFHSNTFGKITGLIYINTFCYSNVVT